MDGMNSVLKLNGLYMMKVIAVGLKRRKRWGNSKAASVAIGYSHKGKITPESTF